GRRRSVDRGTRGSAIELRNHVSRGTDAVNRGGRPHRQRRHWRAAAGPRAVEDPAHAWKLLAREPGDPSPTRTWHRGSAGEGHRPHVWHARGREVGGGRSTREPVEQRWTCATCGDGGGKAARRGEHDQ